MAKTVGSDKQKKRKLEMTVAALQDRWGVQAIRRLKLGQRRTFPHVSTGFPSLDKALAIGGLPRGRISEIIGVPTSGMATIGLKVVANAQEKGGTAIYIDLGQTFDPDYAARCGLALNQLVLVRPYSVRQGLAILQDFVTGGGASALVFDMPFSLLNEPRPRQILTRTLGRLIAPLGQANCVLLFLTTLPPKSATTPVPVMYPDNAPFPHHAAVRLFIQRERWIYRQRDIYGYQAQVLVVKNKLGPAGQQVRIAITFNGGATEDAGGGSLRS